MLAFLVLAALTHITPHPLFVNGGLNLVFPEINWTYAIATVVAFCFVCSCIRGCEEKKEAYQKGKEGATKKSVEKNKDAALLDEDEDEEAGYEDEDEDEESD